MNRILLLLCVFGSIASNCPAQSNELAFVIGGTVSPDSSTPFPTTSTRTPLKISSGITYETVYARRLFNVHIGSGYLELPIVGTPSRTVTAINVATRDFSSIFFTPSLKLKLRPVAGIAPFFSVGGGFAHFNTTSGAFIGTSPGVSPLVVIGASENTGALQFGAGVDLKTPLSRMDLRAEVRDFRTGRPNFQFPVSLLDSDTQHNLFVGGGIVLHFSLPRRR
ncbi:MAG TPA: hypothetical protein VF493_04160 [Terriglobales bacterium]